MTKSSDSSETRNPCGRSRRALLFGIFACLSISSFVNPLEAGIWLTSAEIQSRPTTGAAWSNLLVTADEPAGTPNLSDQDDDTDVRVLARALVHVRTGTVSYRTEVVQALQSIAGGNSEDGTAEEPGRTLALGRNLAAYVIAADLIDLGALDPTLDAAFRAKLSALLTKDLDGRSLRSTHEDRPNNWGTMAGASRAAVAAYLGDTNELAQAAQVFRGFLGDRTAYAGFNYHDDLSWHCSPSLPVGINPIGCRINGIEVGGAQPEEMRRGSPFQWPPTPTTYPWEGLQGALVQAEILHRAGYDAWNWSDYALLRASLFLYAIGWPAEGDDEWQPWLLNHVYGTSFPVDTTGARFGKIMGWTDWTHGTLPARRTAPPLASLRAIVSAGEGTVSPPITVVATGTIVQVAAAADPYFVFDGWTGDLATSNPSADVTLVADVEIEASFAALAVTNGAPLWWLAEHGLGTDDAAALADPDGDGAVNWEEYFAGTIPTNAASVLDVSVQPQPDGALLLSWPSSPGCRYTLQTGMPFQDLISHIDATPPTNTMVHFPVKETTWYRVQLNL